MCFVSCSIVYITSLGSEQSRRDATWVKRRGCCIVHNVVCHLLTWETHQAGETLLEWNVAEMLYCLQCTLSPPFFGNVQSGGYATWVKRRGRNWSFCGLGCMSPESSHSVKCPLNCDSMVRNRDWVTKIPRQATVIRELDPHCGTKSSHWMSSYWI